MEDRTFHGTIILRDQAHGLLAIAYTVNAINVQGLNPRLKIAASALFSTWHRPYVALFEVRQPCPHCAQV